MSDSLWKDPQRLRDKIERQRDRVRRTVGQVADVEEQVAATNDQLAETRGDPRYRVRAEDARREAEQARLMVSRERTAARDQ